MCINMSPETIALTLFVVVIFFSQLASGISIIPEWDISQKTIPQGLPVAIAAAESSVVTVWFMKITNDIDMANDLIRDSCGNCVLARQHYLTGLGHFLEKDNMVKNGHITK